jgi:hypothetical protein
VSDDDLATRLRDAEEALRGLHHRVLDAERELAAARGELAAERGARERAEHELAELRARRDAAGLDAPRRALRRLLGR